MSESIVVDGRSHVRIEGFEIRHYGAGAYGKGVYLRYASDYLLQNGRMSAITLRARNILGETGPEPGYGGVDYPLPPRTIMLGLEQQF